MNVVTHNLSAMNAQRMYSLNLGIQAKSIEKLSSGYKINRSADDAAGLSISEKMRKQIRGLTQASRNAEDGISAVQIADGALEEVHAMLQRGNELAVRAANGTMSVSDRADINAEIQQLKEAIDQISTNTKFNEMQLFPESGLHPALATVVTSNSYTLDLDSRGVTKITHESGSPGVGSGSAVNTGNALADKIAGEFVPNAVDQILGTFGSLSNALNAYGSSSDKLKMALDISYIDGPNGTLAYVQGSFKSGNQELSKLSMKVDSADFSEDDIKNNSSKLGKLESTIAHEMMHAVMDAAMSARMCPGGAEDLPLWFTEGTAQLTGGGFTTGWNDELKSIVADGGSDVDTKIGNYLKKYKISDSIANNNAYSNRVYGHGYLAAAYLGHLVSGQSTVSDASIAEGMNTVFQALIDNPDKTLKRVVNELLSSSSKSYNDVMNDINNGTADGVDFVKALTQATGAGGAGSVISSGGLSAGAKDVLGDSSEHPQKIFIDVKNITTDELNEFGPNANAFSIQAGSDNLESNRIILKLFRMSSADLGLSEVGNFNKEDGTAVNALSMEGARSAIDSFSDAIKLVSGVRSYYGALQNRMEHTIRNLENVIENTTTSESKLRDTDMASEMVVYAKQNILIQAGQSVLAQANHSNEGILSIL